MSHKNTTNSAASSRKGKKKPKPFRFGVSLDGLPCTYLPDCGNVPAFLVEAGELILCHQTTEGLFCKSCDLSQLNQLKAKVEGGEGLSELDVHEVTSLVKTFFRLLPEPLIPCLFHDPLLSSMELPSAERTQAVQGLCFSLPAPNLSCLRYFLGLLSHIASHADDNRMTPRNLAVVLTPCLIRLKARTKLMSPEELRVLPLQTALVEHLIRHADIIGSMTSQLHLHSLKLAEELLRKKLGKKKKKKGKPWIDPEQRVEVARAALEVVASLNFRPNTCNTVSDTFLVDGPHVHSFTTVKQSRRAQSVSLIRERTPEVKRRHQSAVGSRNSLQRKPKVVRQISDHHWNHCPLLQSWSKAIPLYEDDDKEDASFSESTDWSDEQSSCVDARKGEAVTSGTSPRRLKASRLDAELTSPRRLRASRLDAELSLAADQSTARRCRQNEVDPDSKDNTVEAEKCHSSLATTAHIRQRREKSAPKLASNVEDSQRALPGSTIIPSKNLVNKLKQRKGFPANPESKNSNHTLDDIDNVEVTECSNSNPNEGVAEWRVHGCRATISIQDMSSSAENAVKKEVVINDEQSDSVTDQRPQEDADAEPQAALMDELATQFEDEDVLRQRHNNHFTSAFSFSSNSEMQISQSQVIDPILKWVPKNQEPEKTLGNEEMPISGSQRQQHLHETLSETFISSCLSRENSSEMLSPSSVLLCRAPDERTTSPVQGLKEHKAESVEQTAEPQQTDAEQQSALANRLLSACLQQHFALQGCQYSREIGPTKPAGRLKKRLVLSNKRQVRIEEKLHSHQGPGRPPPEIALLHHSSSEPVLRKESSSGPQNADSISGDVTSVSDRLAWRQMQLTQNTLPNAGDTSARARQRRLSIGMDNLPYQFTHRCENEYSRGLNRQRRLTCGLEMPRDSCCRYCQNNSLQKSSRQRRLSYGMERLPSHLTQYCSSENRINSIYKHQRYSSNSETLSPNLSYHSHDDSYPESNWQRQFSCDAENLSSREMQECEQKSVLESKNYRRKSLGMNRSPNLLQFVESEHRIINSPRQLQLPCFVRNNLQENYPRDPFEAYNNFAPSQTLSCGFEIIRPPSLFQQFGRVPMPGFDVMPERNCHPADRLKFRLPVQDNVGFIDFPNFPEYIHLQQSQKALYEESATTYQKYLWREEQIRSEEIGNQCSSRDGSHEFETGEHSGFQCSQGHQYAEPQPRTEARTGDMWTEEQLGRREREPFELTQYDNAEPYNRSQLNPLGFRDIRQFKGEWDDPPFWCHEPRKRQPEQRVECLPPIQDDVTFESMISESLYNKENADCEKSGKYQENTFISPEEVNAIVSTQPVSTPLLAGHNRTSLTCDLADTNCGGQLLQATRQTQFARVSNYSLTKQDALREHEQTPQFPEFNLHTTLEPSLPRACLSRSELSRGGILGPNGEPVTRSQAADGCDQKDVDNKRNIDAAKEEEEKEDGNITEENCRKRARSQSQSLGLQGAAKKYSRDKRRNEEEMKLLNPLSPKQVQEETSHMQKQHSQETPDRSVKNQEAVRENGLNSPIVHRKSNTENRAEHGEGLGKNPIAHCEGDIKSFFPTDEALMDMLCQADLNSIPVDAIKGSSKPHNRRHRLSPGARAGRNQLSSSHGQSFEKRRE